MPKVFKGAGAIDVNESDTIRAMKKQSDWDFDVKCKTVQFCNNSHNSQSDHWIELKFSSFTTTIILLNPTIGSGWHFTWSLLTCCLIST